MQASELVSPVGKDGETEKTPPTFYGILPVIPLALVLVFSQLWIASIKMDIVKAMFIGMTIGMMVEFSRLRDGRKVVGDIQVFFDGLGM